MNSFDVSPFVNLMEGQHFERKSLFEGAGGSKKPRDRRAVRDQVARQVAAFANAEGGVLILGMEDDGSITGHGYPAGTVEEILKVPHTRLDPPQRAGMRVTFQSAELLVFDVAASDAPVMVTGNGYPLRMGDQTLATGVEKIAALKFQGLAQSWESRPSSLTLEDLDAGLLANARKGAGLGALSDDAYLLQRKLADRRGSSLVLRNAAELLFAAHGPEHPNAGIRLFRVMGTERRLGAEYNVEERPALEGALPNALNAALAAVGALLRRPSRLVGNRFRETPEYPEFAWREAILNAVAHRDYGVDGQCVEVHLFDDHMEVTSPGMLLHDVSVETLLSLVRIHRSRNPRLVRALADLGFMRNQGEGIPRLFSEMEGLFLPVPLLRSAHGQFQIALHNTPTLTAADKLFVSSLGETELTDVEFRALLDASRHGKVDNARMRHKLGLDTLGSSALLRRLRDRGLLKLHAAGPKSYVELEDRFQNPPTVLDAAPDGSLDAHSVADKGVAGADKGVAEALPTHVLKAIAKLGKRPHKRTLHAVILEVCFQKWWTPQDLASVLGRRDANKLGTLHLGPMTQAGLLVRLHPENETHPAQAYRASSQDLVGPGKGNT